MDFSAVFPVVWKFTSDTLPRQATARKNGLSHGDAEAQRREDRSQEKCRSLVAEFTLSNAEGLLRMTVVWPILAPGF